MMHYKKDIFDIFQNEKDLYELHKKMIEYIDKVIYNAEIEISVHNYDIYRILEEKIKSPTNKESMSYAIDLLKKEQELILDKFEDFLP